MKDIVVVLGATGNIGTYLVDELAAMGTYEVYACGYRNVNHEYYAAKGVKSVKIDITNKEDFNLLPSQNVKAVVQIAGAMPARMEGYNPQIYIDINISGTLNVLEYCRRNNVEKFIFTQSHSDVAGHWNTGKPIPANASRILNFKGDHAVYIVSKCTAVDLSEHYFQEYGIKNVILRLPTIYNYQPYTEMYVNGVRVNVAYLDMIHKALLGESLEIWGDPSAPKDIVYVKDFAQMVIKSIGSPKARGFYNVATGKGTSLEEQVFGIKDVFCSSEKRSEIIYRPEKPSQTSYLYDISNAMEDLGYSPKYSYREMLDDMKKELSLDRFKHLSNPNIIFK